MLVMAGFPASGFGAQPTAAGSRENGAAPTIAIVDQNGRLVPDALPAADSQIFDVTVAPGGNLVFSPDTLNISVGDTVRWTWGSSGHSVTSGGMCAVDSQFCSPTDTNCGAGVLSNTGAVYEHTFNQSGTYSYFCVLHCSRGMTGTINVASPLQLMAAVSRKTHGGGAGTFDVNLPLSGTPGVECRTGGASGDHSLVFTCSNNLVSGSASVTGGTGSVSGSPTFSGNTMTVNVTGAANAQTLTVTLSNVTDQFSQVLPDTPVSVGLLIGDINGNGTINASDVAQTKSQIGQLVAGGNFRTDVNINGAINGTDVAIVKSHIGQSAASPSD
jgi:plastocyanin